MKTIFKIAMMVMFLTNMIPLTSCNPQKQISGYSTFETECLNIELDGSQTVKVWGQGKNRGDAVEQAKKNGIRDVLFKGILNGKGGCETKPIVFEVNAQQNHQDYFNRFFTDGGPYLKFISMADEKFKNAISKDRKPAGEQVTYGVVVRILRTRLRDQMIADKIINL